MKIYFAGAIRAGRDDHEVYAALIAVLREFGEVLTEHIGSNDLSAEDKARPTSAIFQRDYQWLLAADLVVAEVTIPSLGVGYELGTAEAKGIPVICLFRQTSGRSLSAMIDGNPAFTVVRYDSREEAQKLLRQKLQKVRAVVGL